MKPAASCKTACKRKTLLCFKNGSNFESSMPINPPCGRSLSAIGSSRSESNNEQAATKYKCRLVLFLNSGSNSNSNLNVLCKIMISAVDNDFM